jgi:hypothetical protein
MALGISKLNVVKITQQSVDVQILNHSSNDSLMANDSVTHSPFDVRFLGIGDNSVNHLNIGEVQTPINQAFEITRLLAKADLNTIVTTATTIDVMDDGAAVATISIPAGDTTLKDSGALAVSVAAQSMIAFRLTVGSPGGSLGPVSVEAQIRRALV